MSKVWNLFLVIPAADPAMVISYGGDQASTLSQQLSDGLPWNFVQTFMVPRSCNYRLSLLLSTAKSVSKYQRVFGIHSL